MPPGCVTEPLQPVSVADAATAQASPAATTFLLSNTFCVPSAEGGSAPSHTPAIFRESLTKAFVSSNIYRLHINHNSTLHYCLSQSSLLEPTNPLDTFGADGVVGALFTGVLPTNPFDTFGADGVVEALFTGVLPTNPLDTFGAAGVDVF